MQMSTQLRKYLANHKASGKKKVVLARPLHPRPSPCRRHLLVAFSALKPSSGARAFYAAHRARGDTHHQALRGLANRLVGILDGCQRSHSRYDEATARADRRELDVGTPNPKSKAP
jgi:hypothetical protein